MMEHTDKYNSSKAMAKNRGGSVNTRSLRKATEKSNLKAMRPVGKKGSGGKPGKAIRRTKAAAEAYNSDANKGHGVNRQRSWRGRGKS